MKITLIRHGHAVDKAGDIDDRQRPLTIQGRKDFLKTVESHLPDLPTIDMILCSPSVRTRQTCALLCACIAMNEQHIVYDERIYNFEYDDEILRGIIEEMKGVADHIALVGHNHTISALASRLMGTDYHMKKGAILTIEV